MVRANKVPPVAAAPQEYITIKQACEEFDLTYSLVYYLIRSGHVSAERIDGTWRIQRNSVVVYMSKRGTRKPQVQFPPEYLTTHQAHKEFGLKPTQIKYLIDRGELTALRHQGHWGIRRDHLAAYIEKQKTLPKWPPEGFLTAKQASKKFGIPGSLLRGMVGRGRVIGIRNRGWFLAIQRESLETYLRERKAGIRHRAPLPPGILNLVGAGKLAGVTRKAIVLWIKKKGLPAQPAPGGGYHVKETDLKVFLERRARTPRIPLVPAGFLSLGKATDKAHVKWGTLQKWIASGELPARNLPNGRICIRETDLAESLKRRKELGLLNLEEAAKMAGVSAPAVRYWMRRRGLPGQQLPNFRYAVKESDLREFLAHRSRVPRKSNLPDGFVSPYRAAKRAGVSPKAIRNWIEKEDLPAKRLRKGFYSIRESDLEQFLARRHRSHRQSGRLGGKTMSETPTSPPGKRKRRGPFRSPSHLTPNEAGAELGLTGEAVKQWIYKRELPAVKLRNGYWRIKRDDLAAFVKERGEPATRMVMVADDDTAFTVAAERALIEAGYQVQVSVTATDAVMKAQDRAPALLLVNFGLDSGNGWVVAEQIRGLRHTATIPILFTSSTVPGKEELSRMMKIGGQAFLLKPVAPNHLMREIHRALSSTVLKS